MNTKSILITLGVAAAAFAVAFGLGKATSGSDASTGGTGRGWRSPVPPEGGGEYGGFWRSLLHLWGTRAALPFYRVPR